MIKLSAEKYPSFVKYMGSKSKIMDFVLEGINEVYEGGPICDLFAGSASLAGALGQQCEVHSNDIQAYTKILSSTYSLGYRTRQTPSSATILEQAEQIVRDNRRQLSLSSDYSDVSSLDDFNLMEEIERELLHQDFDWEWHLFLKYYAGTWWSAKQCLWIDAIRQVAEKYRRRSCYSSILSSLMFAMAYTSQGTGHYAQYRDAKTESSMSDILIYRRRSVVSYFQRKYDEVMGWLPTQKPMLRHRVSSEDYLTCLSGFQGGLVYADPPYCFVHYSRFYQALETLVRYDYPILQVKGGSIVKGRYREDRHQSPFCIRSQVARAFEELFEAVNKANSKLVLSYSNTGMISLDELSKLVSHAFGNRKSEILLKNHQHMTLGRRADRHRDVQECLVLVT